MGTGDWNDGMNRVGVEGKGESVWNGWFFVTVLNAFATLAERRGQAADASRCRERAEALRAALEANAWDGALVPPGVLRRRHAPGLRPERGMPDRLDPAGLGGDLRRRGPGAGPIGDGRGPGRLVRGDDQLIQLFDPPFDKGALQPGYIKGYVPGIRENGGQYTHAATWVVLADGAAGRRGPRLELCEPDQPDPPRRDARGGGALQGRAVRGLRRRLRRARRTPAAAAGRGTPARRAGCTASRLEAILGFHLEGGTLRLDPCIPRGWPGFEIDYRHRSATYRIRVDNPAGTGRGVRSVVLDGRQLPGGAVPLGDDGKHHEVRVELG